MSEKLEKEKRFLIKPPHSWIDLAKLFDGIIDIKRISQTYLKPEEGEQAIRVRKTIEGLTGNTNTIYHFNQKEPVETGAHKEKEHEISEKQYQKYLKKADPSKCEIEKTRFVFDYQDQTFELDLFKGHLKGLAILELEMFDIDDTIELPPFLKVVREITKEKNYNNFNLANEKLKDKINGV
jgi:CYTH domain-containing protein